MRLKVGILGCASIAKRSLAPAFAAHTRFELHAIGSRSLDNAKEFASSYSGVKACAYDEIINDPEIDLVYCPLPTGLHYEWVLKCLENRKHVLCEKSLACSYAEVQRLVDAARRNKCFLMESFQFRFHPQNVYVKKLLSEKAIGEIRNIYVKFGFPPFPDGDKNIRYSRALGGGALLDAGAYTIKTATYLLDDEVRVEKAYCSKIAEGHVDLDGTLWLQGANGVVVNAAYGFHNFYQCGYEIWGETGRIALTRAFTARPDFAAEVLIETQQGAERHMFQADHFSLMLDYIAEKVANREFESEYAECLAQSKILEEAKNALEDL